MSTTIAIKSDDPHNSIQPAGVVGKSKFDINQAVADLTAWVEEHKSLEEKLPIDIVQSYDTLVHKLLKEEEHPNIDNQETEEEEEEQEEQQQSESDQEE